MATLEYLLRNGIKDAVDADSDLNGAIEEFYYVKVPGGAVMPYLILSFGATSQYEALQSLTPVATDVTAYFDIYSSSVVSVEAETIQLYLNTLFDGKVVTVTGYKPMTMRRGAEITLFEEESQLWHINSQYKGTMIPS